MEGREYSSTGNVYPGHIRPNSDDEEEEDLVSTQDETYMIQVPKDQIYRVPPLENAIFVEQRRIAVTERESRFTLHCMLLCILV
ncbi:hypothetical protein Tco_1328367 [Tanacetum coccineum]